MPDDFIPVANPGLQVAFLEHELFKTIKNFLSSGMYILGKSVEAFESKFADFIGINHCIGVGNGTDALAIALKASGIQPGDEVITVSHTAVATVAAIEQIDAVPVLVDIDPVTRCMDPALLTSLISEKTRAILPVHIYGQPAPMEEILSIARHYALKVIEDCAQAHGAEIKGKMVGTFGDAAAFSFYPTKNLGALGDAGAVVSNNEAIFEKANMIRQYGWKDRYISTITGFNSRLDEIQAAILCVKLPYLLDGNKRRRKIAERYSAAINCEDLVPPALMDGTLHAMHLFVLECEERESFALYLKSNNIGSATHYPKPIHQQPGYAKRLKGSDRLNNTEKLYERILSIPMYPELTDIQVDRICLALSNWRPE